MSSADAVREVPADPIGLISDCIDLRPFARLRKPRIQRFSVRLAEIFARSEFEMGIFARKFNICHAASAMQRFL